MLVSDRCKKALDLVEEQIILAKANGDYYETEPGDTLLEYYPDILKELSAGVRSIVVTGTFNRTNALAASTCAHFWGIEENVIRKGLEKTQPAFGRFEIIDTGNAKSTFCLVKNTDGFSAISNWLLNEKHDTYTGMVLAFNENEGDDLDMAWIENNDYTGITSLYNRIYITGDCSELVARLIRQAGSEPVILSAEEVLHLAENHNGNLLISANLTALLVVRKQFVEHGYVKEYWETE